MKNVVFLLKNIVYLLIRFSKKNEVFLTVINRVFLRKTKFFIEKLCLSQKNLVYLRKTMFFS